MDRQQLSRQTARPDDVTLDADHSFMNALFSFQAGQTIPVVFQRQGREQTVQVTLGERPNQP